MPRCDLVSTEISVQHRYTRDGCAPLNHNNHFTSSGSGQTTFVLSVAQTVSTLCFTKPAGMSSRKRSSSLPLEYVARSQTLAIAATVPIFHNAVGASRKQMRDRPSLDQPECRIVLLSLKFTSSQCDDCRESQLDAPTHAFFRSILNLADCSSLLSTLQ